MRKPARTTLPAGGELVSITPTNRSGWFHVKTRKGGLEYIGAYPGKDELDVLGTIMRVGKEKSPWD